MQIHEFDPVIYPLKLWIIKNPTKNIIDDNYDEWDHNPINHKSGVELASVYDKIICEKKTQKYGVLILIKSKMPIKYIAHEATHAARIIWVWLNEDYTGREADAYLVGWIAECINEVRKSK